MFSSFGAVVQLGVRFAPGACEVEGSNPSGPTTNFSLIKRFLGLFLRKKFSKPSFYFLRKMDFGFSFKL